MSDDINVGAISEALNNKVDLNQLNTSSAGLSYGSGWSMPSDNYEDLTLGASGTTHTAPANGYVAFSNNSSTPGQYIMITGDFNIQMIATSSYSQELDVYLPVRKGQIFTVYYNATGTLNYFRFYYAVGEEVV